MSENNQDFDGGFKLIDFMTPKEIAMQFEKQEIRVRSLESELSRYKKALEKAVEQRDYWVEEAYGDINPEPNKISFAKQQDDAEIKRLIAGESGGEG